LFIIILERNAVKMNIECACNSISSGQTTPEADNKFYNFSQINQASIASEKSTDITIMTEEGDKVTLSSDIQIDASLTTYNSKALTNTTYTESRGKLFAFDANRQIDIAVEGDLNDQEMEEIEKVLKSISEMIDDFLSGKEDQSAENTGTFADLTTISNVEAEFEIKKSLTLVNYSSVKYAAYSAVQEIREPSKVGSGDSGEDDMPVNRLTDRMLQRVKNSGIGPEKFIEPADRMFSRRSRAFRHHGPAGRRKMSLNRLIRADFFQKLKKLSTAAQGAGRQGTGEVENTASGFEAAISAEATSLEARVIEKSDSFKLAYSAGNQTGSV
jgi:hypothetical protein